MKEQMIKDLTAKVAEVQEAREVVDIVMDSIEELESSGKEVLVKMEQELQVLQEALTMAQDLGEARLIKQQIHSLQEDLELQQAVTEAQIKAMYVELEDKAEAFFAVHKSACFLFRTVDNYMIVNTSLSELSATMEKMQGFSNALSGRFAGVRAILLDTKIVALEEQNMPYRGTHLGQRDLNTKLMEFDYEIRPYIRQLRTSGLEIL
ncbi:hypothetical protein AJ85_18570 [Alkalihalobacillus alcalophilus ATCC 27647 = CGMCC 1.3604]|uniref:Uncharacterized protein n=1 Tax=Alkalihalobacillus alcalophilus ATCC 27647 = CGMCC 1.3604 TaxID=1218173 RepID=A0A094WK15_ALKAL|nr:hypothetical protein [Alkalihalobacillus alcalophilus]KGA98119.1 hypothetical protein BALCAV_0206230 [Alkalihalobacillus alcalophilus ATCC 27647 = CGMCC 1.3604]MED1561459.1 hypothetical protein [Alkalihalobacillus alcalophilus]THG89302.1 hypothetical protein AJ85_18570 [Alkalihalobacillus alcalophilus ATCC 27647 = CGMCC 1.3604]